MLRSMDRGHCVGAYIERNSKDWSSRPEVQLGLAGKISAKSRRRRPHLLSVNTTFSVPLHIVSSMECVEIPWIELSPRRFYSRAGSLLRWLLCTGTYPPHLGKECR